MAFGGDEVRRILFDFKGDSSNLNRATGQAARGMKDAEGAGRKLSGALRVVGPVAAIAGAGALVAAAGWAAAGVDMAGTARVVEDSFRETFGDASTRLEEQLDTLRRSLGLSKAEFQQLALGMGQLQTAAGASREEAAAFAEEIFTAAGDIAAFNGRLEDADQVLGAIQAALRGEFDPLEQFAIKLKQSDVNARALADTGKLTTQELSQLELQTASLAIIQEQLADETGSLEEQFDTATVKSNIMKAAMVDLQTEVGDALIPIKLMALEFALRLIPTLEKIPGLIDDLVAGFKQLWQWGENVSKAMGDMWDAFERLVVKFAGGIANPFRSLGGSIMGLLPGRHSGGRVPGPTGSSQLMRLQGGEEVTSAAAAARGAPGGAQTIINVTVEAGIGDPMEIGRQIVDVLREYTRQTGPADISVRR